MLCGEILICPALVPTPPPTSGAVSRTRDSPDHGSTPRPNSRFPTGGRASHCFARAPRSRAPVRTPAKAPSNAAASTRADSSVERDRDRVGGAPSPSRVTSGYLCPTIFLSALRWEKGTTRSTKTRARARWSAGSRARPRRSRRARPRTSRTTSPTPRARRTIEPRCAPFRDLAVRRSIFPETRRRFFRRPLAR